LRSILRQDLPWFMPIAQAQMKVNLLKNSARKFFPTSQTTSHCQYRTHVHNSLFRKHILHDTCAILSAAKYFDVLQIEIGAKVIAKKRYSEDGNCLIISNLVGAYF
jgi:hypothetical protein